MKLQHLVQDLIDTRKIIVDPTIGKSLNAHLGMYKNAFPKHQGKPSTFISNHSNTTNHINHNVVPFEYSNTIGCINYFEGQVNMICVKGVDS